MSAQNNVGFSLLAILCGALWVAFGSGILYSFLPGFFELSTYSYLLGGCALLGVVGATALVAKKTWGLHVAALAAISYLIVFLANFYSTSVSWQLEDASIADAVYKALHWRWRMVELDFQRERSWQAAAIFFYEFAMPLLQLVVLFLSIRSLTYHSTGPARKSAQAGEFKR
jgi:hypothetical protein